MVGFMKEVLIKTAKESGKILLDNIGGEKATTVLEQKSRYDYSTKMDKLIEDKIIQDFRENGIKGTVIAEEGGETKLSDDDYKIYVDPLDGTINYSIEIPVFCTSIGVKKGNEMKMGVIYYPVRDELFFAERGKGAFLNGEKIYLSGQNSLEDSTLEVGWSSDQKKERDDILKKLEMVVGVRMLCCAALAVAFVGCGRFDGLVHTSAHHPWDIAAGSVIIEEAGGKIIDFNGKRWDENSETLVASNKVLHKQLLEVLEDWDK